MAWSSPTTAVTGGVIPASLWNTYARDNLNYLKGQIDGTGTDAITLAGATTIGGFLTISNTISDTKNLAAHPTATGAQGFKLGANGSNGASEISLYNMITNPLSVFVFYRWNGSAWASALEVGPTGKVIGLGFYDSGIFSLAASGGTTAVSHGLGAKPRFYAGVWGTTNSDSALINPVHNRGSIEVYIQELSSTTITVVNLESATRYIKIFAML